MKTIHKNWLLYAFATFTLTALLTVAMGCDDDDDGTGPDPRGNENVVSIQDMSFDPDTIVVGIGETVTWTNRDSVAHTVRSGSPDAPTDILSSGNIAPGQTYAYTFSDSAMAGDTIEYYCEIHPEMTAVVVLEGDGGPGPEPGGETDSVAIVDMAFSPDTLVISDSTEVTWTNQDSVAHTVRSGSPATPTDILNSGSIAAGETYVFTFTNDDDVPDTINYFCEIHPEMLGVIIVE